MPISWVRAPRAVAPGLSVACAVWRKWFAEGGARIPVRMTTLAELARARGGRVYGRVVVPVGSKLTLEQVLTHPGLFALTTATNVQRAICRVSDGLPLGDLWNDPDVREALGGAAPEPGQVPKELDIFAAIRGGKSKLAAAKAFQATQEADLTPTSIGDEVRVPVLSVDKDTAHAVFRHLVDNVMRAPAMRSLVVGQPTTDAVKIRHPSGRVIEIKVTAIARAGATLVGRWLPCLIFDEAPRIASEQDSVESLEESIRAVEGRMLPGAQRLLIGSPHAPTGLCYRRDREFFGKPDPAKCIVIRATGPMLNPGHWTPEQCEAVRVSDPIAHQANVLAQFVTSDVTMFALRDVERNIRPSIDPLPYNPLQTYVGAIDPATRRNHWTLVLATRGLDDAGRMRDRVVLTATFKPGSGAPDEVFAKIAELVKPYGVKTLRTDQWANDLMRVLAQQVGLGLAEEVITQARKFELYDRLRLLTETNQVEFNGEPTIVSDLMRVKKVVTASGVRVDTPEAHDGSHCDVASALVLAFAYPISEPRPEMPAKNSPEYWDAKMKADKAQALAEIQRQTRKKWRRGGPRAVLG
jgi:hypothetical protein